MDKLGDVLEMAIRIAMEAHWGQVDKGGHPYILHPLRVMCSVEGHAAKMVAVLHDTVEDSDWALDSLSWRGMPDEVVDAVDCLTKRGGESYEGYLERVKGNQLAVKVKRADIMDNMDVARFACIKPEDVVRLSKKYTAAWEMLKEVS